MANKCPICSHDNRLEIDRQLVQGKQVTSLALKYGVPEHVMSRHKNKHLTYQLQVAYDKKNKDLAVDVVEAIYSLVQKTQSILERAESKNQSGLSLAAIRELRVSFELIGKIQFAYEEMRNKNTQIDPAELEEFRVWKANQHKSTLDLDLLDKKEREFVRSIAIKKLASQSGVTSSKADRVADWTDEVEVIAEDGTTIDAPEIASTGSGFFNDDDFGDDVPRKPKMQRTR